MTIIMYTVKEQHTRGHSMRVSREQAAQNRDRILDAAAQLFRERGFDGIGLVDLMKNAGLTHGGFYGHFASKDDLIAQASARELTRSLAQWKEFGERAPGDRLSAIAAVYLTATHRDNPGAGCMLASLGPEVSRQGPAVRRTVTEYVRSICDLISTLVPGKSKPARRQKAISTYATLVGTMVLARAVDDPALSQEILNAGRAAVKG